MAKDKSMFELVRHPIKVRTLTVKRVETLTPRMRRITLCGPELEGFTSLAPEDHVKVFFPRPGESLPILPTLGPLGLILPTFGPKPVARDYTPRRHDPARGELVIDFYLHGQGSAARWAAQAEPGQTLGVAGPRGSYVLSRSFAWQLFVGDETALPEFARRIEELPTATRALTLAIVDGAEDEHPFSGRGAIESLWIHRCHTHDAAAGLVDALARLTLPEGEGFVWLAGEAGEMRAALKQVLARGIPASHTHVSGHWKRGVVNHDHHEPVHADAS